ncbi:Holliday junction branch migration protein RuvA [Borrelia crocidurae]|uniref:Holliday junction branch migration complex subunit RuvA n=1 Tax=Borrelia crocidurae (strain Achema) TaxID=1155096 RepID=I0FBF2_BORCA|nr:Holliday junction branch migration protein RuvA [Borrelia crocidurae]AFI30808.1 Holliday junction ATP-dependent DNA helicase RuvA [Borrelia crocidurae str. Achema]
MINKIYGKIVDKKESSIIILAFPFEFEILVSSFCKMELRLLEDVEILTYFHFRDDDVKLFGFLNISEREVFEDLIGVDGIGPKAALKILSGIKYDAFRLAIEKEDINLISKVKGIGNKIAGKIFLKLRGKLVKGDESSSYVLKFKELEQSIVNMGFDRKLVVVAFREIMLSDKFLILKEADQEQFLFTETLKRLSV